MPVELPARFFARLSGELLNFYGPTETAVDAAFWSCVPEDSRRRNVPIGRPIGNARLYIVDRALRMVPVGVPGELCVGGEGLARGYLRRPDLTAERFVPDPFPKGEATDIEGARLYRTGDRARFLPDGTIEFLGRIDRQLKIRGHRIEPGEIEAAVREHPSIGDVAVVSRVDPSGVPSLIAYVAAGSRRSLQGLHEASGAERPEDSTGEAFLQTRDGDGDDLRTFLGGKLPAAMIPMQFVSLAEIPRTPSGKVDVASLPDPGAPVSRASFIAPRDPTERILAEIWAQVLGVESVGIHDNFFELGGDSILSMQVASKARARGIEIVPRQVFDLQTISDLAAASAKAAAPARGGEARPPADDRDAPAGEAPLTPIQRWFFEQDLPEPHHWNQAVLLQARRTMDVPALRRALEHVILHHDVMRMRFRDGPMGWTQKAAEDDPGPAFEVVDLSSHPSSQQAEAIEDVADRAQRGLDITGGPLVRAVLYELGAGKPQRLLIVIHHLVIDGVSWRILLEDLETVYGQIVRGNSAALPGKTTSFGRWASRLADHARSGALRTETEHWLGVAAGDVPPLPNDGEGENLEGSAATILVSLDPRETRALLNEVPATYRTEINDVLLTALAQAFERWTGRQTLLVDLEGHGREAIFDDVDLSRTVGWFTTVFPVRLDLPDGAEGRRPGPALKAIKEQLRAVPGRGIGYGLLRYSGADPEIARRLAEGCRAEVSFNYMGQLDGSVGTDAFFAWAPESAGVSHGLQGRRSHAIEVNAQVAGGRLEIEWTFGVLRHRRTTIESLAGEYLEALRGLIEHCQAPEAGGFTPSDFPQAHLSQKELDELLARLGRARGRAAES